MDQEYRQELRSDSSQIIFPFTVIIVVFVSMAAAVSYGFADGLHFLAYTVVGPLGIVVAWNFIKRGQQELGGWIFTIVNLIMITGIMMVEYEPEQIGIYPYLYGVFIVISSMILPPSSGFVTWLLSLFAMSIGFWFIGELSLGTMITYLSPIVVNLLLSLVAYLSAVEWQIAVESTSHLHLRVQQRRDDLFKTQEELRMTNGRLQFMNSQLDLARQDAVNERDLRTRFMNNVSHELRTPLNSIVNFAHILTLGGRGAVTEGQQDYLGRIEQSGWHLLNVLNDLLDMAQIESGEFKLHLEPTHLYHICEEAMTTTRGLLLDKETEIDLLRDYPKEWPTVNVDQMRIKQALINLLGNSAKYTEAGHIALRVMLIGGKMVISVEDTGIGIPPEYHQAVFEEFRQVDETAARKRIGTGLGLPITKHLIERHGGALAIESVVGEGSTFTITLPIHETETAVTPQLELA
jgi:signal transduction histidine kinase